MKRFLPILLMTLCLTAYATAAGNWGEEAADFPPGAFSDGRQYQLEDYKGKVVVLFFYEQQCPSCRATIPTRNKLVEYYKDKPVKFIAIAAGDSMADAKKYVGSTKLAMPVFADPLSLMEGRYGQSISLNNIYQFRIIGPDGKVVGYKFESADIDKALEGVKLKYNPADFDPKLKSALSLLEFNQYDDGLKLVRAQIKNGKGATQESAQKLYDLVKAEGEAWFTQAKELTTSDPVKAYDLYAKISDVFTDDDLAKRADEALKSFKSNETVKNELAARKMYEKLMVVLAQATGDERSEVREYAKSIVKKYPDTPTAQRAKSLSEELGA